MAQRIALLPGMIGAMVVAFDEEGEPLTSGAHDLSLIHPGTLLEGLLDLRRGLGVRMNEPSWFGTSVCRSTRPGRTLALHLREAGKPVGLLLIDVMVAIKDIKDLANLDEQFFEDSKRTGIRLCHLARDEDKRLPNLAGGGE